jgi:hypothetical protein
MAYSSDIDALNPDHRWDFDGDATDQIGSADGTGTGMTYPASPICRDVTNVALTDSTGDRVSIPTTTDINNSAQSRKAVGGWFSYSAAQGPPKRIYGEGNQSTNFQFVGFIGNNVMFEVVDTGFDVQVYGFYLEPNRPYHLFGMFSGNGYDNEVKFFIDGVEMTVANPSDRQPDAATLSSRGVAEFADPAGTVGIGGESVLLNSPVNGYYNQWATWDGANADLSDTDIRVELFEKGALPDVTISTNTEANMQTALDAYADTVRGDAPLCIAVEPVTGGGDFELELDNITFDELASIHVQYTGTSDTLTLINTNGAACSITSAPFGGSITLKTRTTITITVKDLTDFSVVEGARVYIVADAGGDLVEGTVILNTTTNVSGIATTSFDYTSDQPIVGYVRQGTSSTYYVEGSIAGPITSEGLSETILLIRDE